MSSLAPPVESFWVLKKVLGTACYKTCIHICVPVVQRRSPVRRDQWRLSGRWPLPSWPLALRPWWAGPRPCRSGHGTEPTDAQKPCHEEAAGSCKRNTQNPVAPTVLKFKLDLNRTYCRFLLNAQGWGAERSMWSTPHFCQGPNHYNNMALPIHVYTCFWFFLSFIECFVVVFLQNLKG